MTSVRHNHPCGFLALAAMLLAMLGIGGVAQGANITVRAGLSANSVFVGEPVRFQIQVSGSESPEQPDLSKLDGFRVRFQSGGNNSRRSIRIINGRRTENVQLGYVFNYELRATREGRLVIPAIPVKVDGQTVRTQPLVVSAQKPSETENYKLRLNLSKTRVYVGEQVMLEAVFYYRGEVAGTQLALPILDNGAFKVLDLDDAQPPNRTEMLDGQRFQSGRVRKVVVPRRAGTFAIKPATLSFQGQEGFELTRDFFGNAVRRPKYKNFVIPSNQLTVTVLPLPSAGRPANFAGHVGEYSLSVQASPTEVNVGDPITLNIAVSGPPLLSAIELPPLHEQETLTKDFKVPSDIADGSVNGNFKVFTQTVRALREDVSAIPPIELVYFDSAKGRYETARTQAVPVVVRPTRVVTAGDAEGVGPVGAAQTEIQSLAQGIAHNYSGPEALSRQVLGFSGLTSPGRLAVVVGPPVLYAILFAVVGTMRRRHANPATTRARRAFGRFQREVPQAANAEEVLTVFCHYLGDKLAMTGDALTFRDVDGPLRTRGVTDEQLARIKGLFTAGEASRFAGAGGEGEASEARGKAVNLVKELEKELR